MTIKKLLDKIDSLFPMPQENQTAKQIAEDISRIEILVKLVEWINQEISLGWTEEERSEKRQEVTQTEEKRGFTDSDIVNGLME